LEPFGGAASVLLNKSPVDVEVYNDLDIRVSRLFKILQTQGIEFAERLKFVPYSEYEFNEAAHYPPNATNFEKAVCDFIRWRQSFGGQGRTWSCTTKRARGGMAGDVNAWWTAIDQLVEITNRLKRVQILYQPALNAIKRFDDKECLIYCDPPYLHETRSPNSRDIYGIEMTENEHEKLGVVLNKCKSKVIVSGYPSNLYDKMFQGWRKITFNIANHASGATKKQRKSETLWLNWK
jgi:DNA adenine methylase